MNLGIDERKKGTIKVELTDILCNICGTSPTVQVNYHFWFSITFHSFLWLMSVSLIFKFANQLWWLQRISTTCVFIVL